MLYCIMYSSEMNPLSESEIDDIKRVSILNNQKSSISGVLVSNGQEFLQLLEGEYEEVVETYQRINFDSRHKNLSIHYQGDVIERSFAEWDMKYNSVDAKKFEQRTGFERFDALFKRMPADRCLEMGLMLFREYSNTTSE